MYFRINLDEFLNVYFKSAKFTLEQQIELIQIALEKNDLSYLFETTKFKDGRFDGPTLNSTICVWKERFVKLKVEIHKVYSTLDINLLLKNILDQKENEKWGRDKIRNETAKLPSCLDEHLNKNNINSVCKIFKNCSSDIQRWIAKQPEVKEESVTDRFLYELSEKIPTLKYKQFTRTEEGRKTGADWEWWFVFSNEESFAARVQAKKLKNKVDNYTGIAYVSNDKLQIERLLDDSANDGFASFYSFYTSESSANTMCGRGESGEGVFLGEANKLRDEFILKPRKKLTPADILKFTNPIPCLFCCPLTFSHGSNIKNGFREHLNRYFPDFSNNRREGNNQEELGFVSTPDYIIQFLSDNIEDYWEAEYRTIFEKTNALVVIDLRK